MIDRVLLVCDEVGYIHSTQAAADVHARLRRYEREA